MIFLRDVVDSRPNARVVAASGGKPEARPNAREAAVAGRPWVSRRGSSRHQHRALNAATPTRRTPSSAPMSTGIARQRHLLANHRRLGLYQARLTPSRLCTRPIVRNSTRNAGRMRREGPSVKVDDSARPTRRPNRMHLPNDKLFSHIDLTVSRPAKSARRHPADQGDQGAPHSPTACPRATVNRKWPLVLNTDPSVCRRAVRASSSCASNGSGRSGPSAPRSPRRRVPPAPLTPPTPPTPPTPHPPKDSRPCPTYQAVRWIPTLGQRLIPSLINHSATMRSSPCVDRLRV